MSNKRSREVISGAGSGAGAGAGAAKRARGNGDVLGVVNGASLDYSGTEQVAATTVVYAGAKALLLQAFAAGGARANALLHRMVKEATPTMDNPVVVTTTTEAAGALVTTHVVLSPTAYSRHNSHLRPEATTAALRKLRFGPAVQVTLVVPTASDAITAIVAAAKAFPKFSMKAAAMRAVVSGTISCLAMDGGDVNYERCGIIAEGARDAARLVDMPTNLLNATTYVKYVQEQVAKHPKADRITTKIIQGEACRDAGLGGIWAVGKASDNLPALVCLTYEPAEEMRETAVPVVAMAGKGIVYDTGGLSIKTKTGMPGMKRDMGGSAALLHAFLAAAANNHPGTLHALLCIAENSVSDRSTRPDDIITQYSGKTVEINNTDAEGRLVLGDGVAYAVRHFNPDVLMDMATLTGAQGISTGKYHGAVYCNNDELEADAIAAGKLSGDLVHPLPYCPEFHRAEFASAVADFKNSVASRSNAQSSCAGQFIGNHIPLAFLETHSWLHVDMAAPAKAGERATGYGVALTCALLRRLAAKRLCRTAK